MEVMFAIGVLLIGIVGLAHVIPIGIHQSADAVTSDKTLIAMENLVGQTILQAESASQSGFVVANRWSTSGVPEGYLPYQPTVADYRFGICVDPWFLTAGFNRRNTTANPILASTFDASTLNGYDRSLFPCYDRGYNPLASPSESLYDSMGNRTTAWGSFTQSLWRAPFLTTPAGVHPHQPRFLRVAPAKLRTTLVPGVNPRSLSERVFASQSAEPSLVTPEEDTTLPAGRRYGGTVAAPVRGSEIGRFSAMSFIVTRENDPHKLRISTAVLKNRIPTINPGVPGTGGFPLSPYTYDRAAAPYYEGEQLAYVQSVAASTMASFASGLGGQVELVMHRAPGQPAPKFRTGQYLMFMRHVYPVRTAFFNSPTNNTFVLPTWPGPSRLDFEWFTIADVVGDPATDVEREAVAVTAIDPGDISSTGSPAMRPVWRITLDLRGPAWLFDDSSRITSGTFDYTPGLASYQDATYAVWMPEVVGVHERTLSLKGR
ncbi:MAG: hypothetical protein MI861_01000 [Pirellulales bacterium]|nr:hypothetical protein [Pirellulales bacterium]